MNYSPQNTHINEIPADLGTPWPVRLVASIVFLNGLFAILEVLSSRFSERIEIFLPFNYEYAKLLGLVAGFLLIYFSSQLLARKHLAWLIVTISSGLIVMAHLVYARDISVIIFPAIAFVLLVIYRDLFMAKSEPVSVAQGIRLVLLSLAIVLVYGVLGFLLLLPRDFHQPFNLWESIVRTIREVSLIGNSDLTPYTRYAQWFLDSLDLLGVVGISFAIISLFRPLTYRYVSLPHDRERARLLLEKYSSSSEDYFKLWPEDKSFYFPPGTDCFIAYKVTAGVAVALGDVIGPAAEHQKALGSWASYCRLYGWSPSLLYVSAHMKKLADKEGWREFKIGEDAVINTASFSQEVARNKHFRHVGNKFSKLGYTTQLIDPPQSSQLIAELAEVSRSWLKLPGRVERGFAMGYFDRRYLSRCRIFVVRNQSGQVEAFINLIPSFREKEASFDLMRHRQDSPTGLMDYLFLELLRQLHEVGVSSLNMGLAPLSGMAEEPDRSSEEWFLTLLYKGQFKLFDFQGLRRYKSKFEPKWEPRYMLYLGGPASFVRLGLAMSRLVSGPPTLH